MTARRVAIVGSGQAGLLAAHGLVRAGHEVTLYSDRTADRWLNGSRPTGTAARFELALAYERELGLAHWDAAAPGIEGVHLTFCPALGNRLVTLTGRVAKAAARALVAAASGRSWRRQFIGGALRVGGKQLGRVFGISPKHPVAPEQSLPTLM